MNLKELALQNQKSCAVALPSNRTAQLLDDFSQNMRNSQRNHSATSSVQPLQNIDDIRNLERNTSATGQNLTAQLLPQKTPQKLRTKNTELRTKNEEKSFIFGGGNSVILANITNEQAANEPHPKGEIKPVLQVAAQSEPLNDGADLNHQLEAQVKGGGVQSPLVDGQLYRKNTDKQSPKFYGDALKTEGTPQIEEAPTVQRKISFNLDDYRHLVTCNQCEHLALTGTCKRLGKRVLPNVMRECDSFNTLKTERISPVNSKPYTKDELHRLLNQAAKPLYFHLIDCQQCSLEDTRYCGDGFGLGNTFDCLLLCFDDAANKRYELMNQVIKARVSGRRAFESLFSDNAPPPIKTALQTRKCGNTPEYEAFINHWTACKVCKPNLSRYCSEGERLEKEANC